MTPTTTHNTNNLEVQKALTMLFEAHREEDPLRIQHALAHLDFLDTMNRLAKVAE